MIPDFWYFYGMNLPFSTPYNLLAIVGPTASGKTALAVALARLLNGEIISADSRQVYRGMDIGTGKDLSEYGVGENRLRAHLIDIVDAGYHYNVFEYQRDFLEVLNNLSLGNRFPLLCGGSGLYIEAVLKNYRLIQVPPDPELRRELSGKSLEELTAMLKSYRSELHNHTDTENERRAIRAIEIARYYAQNNPDEVSLPDIRPLVAGIMVDREVRRDRITRRLHSRIEEGLIEEVRNLLDNGLSPNDLIYYGLEYKYITQYIAGDLGFDAMLSDLTIAIHQFAKRQMTWFRRMERNGTPIHWLDESLPFDDKISMVLKWLKG